MKNYILLFLFLSLPLIVFAQHYSDSPADFLNNIPQHNLTDFRQIYKPVVVSIPPKDAGFGLIKLKSGEIRHYSAGTDQNLTGAWYIYSNDNGLTWGKKRSCPGDIGADFQSPKSGEFIRLFSSPAAKEGIYCARTEGGLDGKKTVWKISPLTLHSDLLRNPVFIPEKSRILIGGSRTKTIVFFSDDDGLSWKNSDWIYVPDEPIQEDSKSVRWHQNGLEPTMTLLKNGQVWMIIRTSYDNFFETFSKDNGETWSTPKPSRFYGTSVMPTLFRMADGKLLFLWCNSTPLPEFPKPASMKYYMSYKEIAGITEDIFTNRDVLHAAISDDDGKTWKGFRELYMTAKRNDPLYGTLGDGGDKSLHQNQCVELGDGKILVSSGQNSAFRVILAFDTKFLYEKRRTEDFSSGIDNVCVFQYISGKVGHCSLNRRIGADVVEDPVRKENKVLKICNPMDSTMVIENQGATWNFPAGMQGNLNFDVYLTKDFKGGKISLIDRWFNPVDTTAYKHSMFDLDISPDAYLAGKVLLEREKWHQIQLSWKGNIAENENVNFEIYLDGRKLNISLPLKNISFNGISYLHLQSRAKFKDLGGFFVDNLEANVK